jgi:hypothetical protein
MNLQERINLLSRLGEYILENGEEWQLVKERAGRENPWFVPEFIELASTNIAERFLQKHLLEEWVKQYNIPDERSEPKNVGVVMAGNIPLVGFHDFLCVFISGHQITIKLSSKDEVLLKHLVRKLYEWEITVQNYVSFAENLKGCNAYIATGSNNTGRYFEQYFGKYPNIIRYNRTSVAILEGTETKEQLEALADDISLYFGLGCRNVTKLFVPKGYDFIPLLTTIKKYQHYSDFHKYRNNYDYQLASLIMNSRLYMTNEAVLMTENTSAFSPVSQVNYEFYDDKNAVVESLKGNKDIQAIVGNGFIEFGKAQEPSLNDYADGVDTMRWLERL